MQIIQRLFHLSAGSGRSSPALALAALLTLAGPCFAPSGAGAQDSALQAPVMKPTQVASAQTGGFLNPPAAQAAHIVPEAPASQPPAPAESPAHLPAPQATPQASQPAAQTAAPPPSEPKVMTVPAANGEKTVKAAQNGTKGGARKKIKGGDAEADDEDETLRKKNSTLDKHRGLKITIGASAIIDAEQDVTRISVAAPEIADFVLLSSRQLYMTGKTIGVTNLTLWNKENKVFAIYSLEVAPDIARLKRALHDSLPDENGIRVTTANDFITLSGNAKSPENVTRAMTLAEAFAPKKVLNLMHVGGVQQIQLEVKVAEASKSALKRFGINLAAQTVSAGNSLLNRAGPLGINETTSTASDITRTVENFRSFFRQLTFLDEQGRLLLSPNVAGVLTLTTGSEIFTAYIDALKEDGHVRILAEPTLMCLSGQSADFLAGGEIPVPVPSGLGTVGIEWKQFGVGLKFTPTIQEGKRINLQVNPEVSELDFANAITLNNFTIPAITTRRAKTVIDLNDGQTFAIAGMLRDTSRQNLARYPIIGDIPILGMLFRSDQYRRDETELVIFVTPRLAKPLDAAGQPLPTDGHRTPSDLNFYVLGMTSYGTSMYRPSSRSVTPPETMSGRVGLDGSFGHILPDGVR